MNATEAGLSPTPSRSFGRIFGAPAWLLLPAAMFMSFIYLLPLLDLTRISVTGPSVTANFDRVFNVALYWDSLVRTMGISLSVVVIAAVFGYPTALLLHRTRGWVKLAVGAAIILPYFVSILIRTYAWMVLLGRRGPINEFLLWIGIIDEPVKLLFTRGAVLLGIVAVLIPIMILSIYSSVLRVDREVLRAAESSGAGPLAVFWRVFFPMTLPGLGAGCLLVFVNSLGFFITPTLLGGTRDQMFAMHITEQSNFLGSEGFLQALAVVMLVVTVIVVAIAARFLGLEVIWGGERKSPGQTARSRIRLPAAVASPLDAAGWAILRALGRLPRVSGPLTVGLLGGFVVVAMVTPIVIVAILSFSSSSFLAFPPQGLSLRWYQDFFSDSQWMAAFFLSARIALMSAAIAVMIGTSAAIGVVRSGIRGKTFIMLALVSPIIVPPVVLGLSLYGIFLQLDLVGQGSALAAAHAIGGIPIVVIIVSASLQKVDRSLEQAAACHGAAPLTVFRTVTLPTILPGILAGGFFSFLHSFDELPMSLFLSGARLKTLPLRLWADVNYQLNPVLAVVSTLEVVMVIVGILLVRPIFAGKT